MLLVAPKLSVLRCPIREGLLTECTNEVSHFGRRVSSHHGRACWCASWTDVICGMSNWAESGLFQAISGFPWRIYTTRIKRQLPWGVVIAGFDEDRTSNTPFPCVRALKRTACCSWESLSLSAHREIGKLWKRRAVAADEFVWVVNVSTECRSDRSLDPHPHGHRGRSYQGCTASISTLYLVPTCTWVLLFAGCSLIILLWEGSRLCRW